MSIINTLITDRSESDVSALKSLLERPESQWTEDELSRFNEAKSKGAYNYTDLNRVTAAMDYINDKLTGYGYITRYRRVEVQHRWAEQLRGKYTLTNLVPNGSFEKNSDWNGVVYDATEQYHGLRSSKLGPGTTVNTTGQVASPIAGHKYYGRRAIKSQGEIQAADYRFELFDGDGAGLNFVFGFNNGNFPDWTQQSAMMQIDAVNGTSYIIRNFVVNAVNPCWTDCLMIMDLTACFGAGNEPDQTWCDEHIPYFDGSYTFPPEVFAAPCTWYEQDVPTDTEMAAYLANVEALRSVLEVLATTPATPASMEALTWATANHIEQILTDVAALISAMSAVFLRPAMPWAVSGGANYFFVN